MGTPDVRSVLLAMADDELIMGHRHSEWTGWAPHIEEDIAFSSIAQDEIGHANLFYQLLADAEGGTPDELALGRPADGYRHAQLCEMPNKDWAFTLARHFLYDSAERIRLFSISRSSFQPLSDVAEKLLREERYHQLHADAWFRRLANGPVEGRHQLALAFSEALPMALGLFEPYEDEEAAVASGVLPESSDELRDRWLNDVVGRIERVGLPFTLASDEPDAEMLPTSSGAVLDEPHANKAPAIVRAGDGWKVGGDAPGGGGRRGERSEHFQDLWEDLTMTYREEPAATW